MTFSCLYIYILASSLPVKLLLHLFFHHCRQALKAEFAETQVHVVGDQPIIGGDLATGEKNKN